VRLARQQELKSEITDEIGLIATRRFEAASGHDEKDKGRTDLVAAAEVYRGLVFGRMESSLGVELYVPFEFWSEIVAHDQTGKPAVRSFVDKLITDFVVHVDGAKFFGEFEGQEEGIARRRDAAADRVVRIVEEKLGKNRDVEAGLSCVVETPLDAGIGLTYTKLGRGRGVVDTQPGIFVGELDAVTNAEIDVYVRCVGDGLIAIKKGHVAKIDFPIQMAGRAWIIGVIRRTTLGNCRGSGNEETEGQNKDPQHKLCQTFPRVANRFGEVVQEHRGAGAVGRAVISR